MQGNKKHADGQSDSSSIGSLLDDTDKEVCSLTDRAFKSLCVAELESAYTECDPTVSPHFSYQFSSKFFRGPRNHALKKNSVSIKPFSKPEEHSTFQQLAKNIQEDKQAITNSTPNIRRKLGLPVLGLRNYKHTSKVSSLIKTFDNVENQESPVITKQSVTNSLPEYELICGDDKAFVGDKTSFLNIQKKFYEFSDMCQVIGSASVSPDMHKRHNKMDLVCRVPRTFYPAQTDNSNRPKSGVSKKTVKNRTGKAKEPVRRGNFLHSENSAFESWNAHHKKLSEVGRATEIILKEDKLTYSEEAPFYKQSTLKVAGPIILEQDFSLDAFPRHSQSQASLSPVSVSQRSFPIAKSSIVQTFPPVCGPLSPVYRIPSSPCLTSTMPPQVAILPVPDSEFPIPLPPVSQIPVPPEAASHGTDTQAFLPQVTLFPEKTNNSELKPPLENICPPWRRQKTIVGKMMTQTTATEVLKMKESLHENPSDVIIPSTEMATFNSHPSSFDASNPFFNITELLTPVILPKQEPELSESQILLVTPPISEAGAAKESEERMLHCSQNNYKSKAPSLLFNLKDIRKRVKSTYSPSPLLRALEDKKKIKEQENLKASVTAARLLEESNKKSVLNDESCYKPCEQPDSTRGKNGATTFNGHLSGNYQTVSSPNAKADVLSYQSRNSLRQDNSVDGGDWEMTNLHPNEPSIRRHPLPSKSSLVHATSEQETYMQNFHLWDPNNKKIAPNQNAVPGSRISPNLFFIAEENMNDNGNQGCPVNENEHKSKSSSEQSFASVLDQPLHKEPFSLMHLFQKACLQESQRTKEEMSEEEKVSSKGKEKAGRQEEHDFSPSSHCTSSNMDGKHEGKEEQSENENVLQERDMREKREERGKSMDSASEGKSEEPLTPTSTSSFKPHLFTIKDNTFKSSPVIKAIKLPLLRSLSCEDAVAGRHVDSEKQAYGPIRATLNIHEVDWPLSKNKSRQKAREVATDQEADEAGIVTVSVGSQMAEKSNPLAESTFRKELRSFYMRELIEDDDVNIAPMFLPKDGKGSEKHSTKGKGRAGKLRPNSASQLNLSLEGNPAQSKQRSPTREKIKYFKNHLLSRQRGGSCMKKIITQETSSPIVSENRSHSPAFSDTFGNTLCLENTSAALGNLASFTIPSPRSQSTVQSAFKSPLSDAIADCNITKPAKTASSSSLHEVTEREDNPSAMETINPTQMSQLTDDADSSMVNERLQLMGQMMKTAAKPPAVPPKTEKALRRAKKLASRRKKSEAQKRLQVESTSESVPGVQCPVSPVHVNLPLTPSESNMMRLQPNLSLSPTPSLPTTQRKLLQDPDSGEYFIVDLPIQLKTFYDPESGRYIQVSIPPSKRNLSQLTPSSESLPPSYVLYSSALPLRVSSVPIQISPSQLSEPPLFMQGAFSESTSDWQQDGQYQEPLDSQPYVEPAAFDVHSQETNASKYNFEKDMSLSANADIISMGAIEDFAVEGIS